MTWSEPHGPGPVSRRPLALLDRQDVYGHLGAPGRCWRHIAALLPVSSISQETQRSCERHELQTSRLWFVQNLKIL